MNAPGVGSPRNSQRSQSGFALLAVMMLVGLIGMISATYLRNVILESQSSPASKPIVDAGEAVHSGLQWGRQALRSGVNVTSTTVDNGQTTASVLITQLGNDRASILSRSVNADGLGATMMTEASRIKQVNTDNPDTLPQIDEATLTALVADPTVPKLYYGGMQRIEDVDLYGLVIIQNYATIYFDNVTIEGAIVSEDALQSGSLGNYDPTSAPTVILDGNLRVDSASFLPGVAMLLPDGIIRDWISPASVQLDGDVIAHTIMLNNVSGALHGNIASVAPLELSTNVEQPGANRTPLEWSDSLDMGGTWEIESLAFVPRVSTISELDAITGFSIP